MALDHETFRKLLKARYEQELAAVDSARKKGKEIDANDVKAMYQLKLISKDQYNDLAKQLRQLAAEQRTEQDLPDGTLGEDIAAIVINTIDHKMDDAVAIKQPEKKYKKSSLSQAIKEIDSDSKKEKPVFDEKRYEFIKKIGEGGMGEVVLRKDKKMGKDVADKKILAERATRQYEERFKREIDITKKFEHPYIIDAKDYGYDSEGNLHFLMEFVRGKEFTKIIEEICSGKTRKYPLSEVLQLFLKVVDTVDYMHERDIIHRDLKPDNIFVDEFGQVKIMDFGLAKDLKLDELIRQETTRLDSDAIKRTGVFTTQQGLVMGTPAYMAPEQAIDSTNVDGRADIYALGAMLYTIIVGEPPHTGKSVQNTVNKVLKEEIIAPIAIAVKNYDIPRELNAIIMKALYKDSEFIKKYLDDKKTKHTDVKNEIAKRRYRKAKDFADDIRAFLSNDPVSVYKDTIADKVSKFSKKKPGKFMTAIVGVPATFLLTAAIAAGYAFFQSSEVEQARADAEQARAESAEKDKKILEKDKKILEKDKKILEKDKKLLAIEKERETNRADAAEDEVEGQSKSQATLDTLKFLRQDEGYYEAALSIINNAVESSPKYWKPYLNRAKHQATFGKQDEAEKDFNKANEVFKKQHGKESVEIWFEAGMFYGLPLDIGGKGEEDKALEYFKKASADKSAFGRLAKAASLMIEGKLKPETIDDKIPQAIEITEELIADTIAKSIDATWLTRAWILGSSVFERDVNRKRKKPELLVKLRQYTKLQETKEALLHVVNENEGNLTLRNFLGMVCAFLNETDRAKEIYTKIIEIRKIAKYYHNRGTVYFKEKNYEKALEDFNEAIRLDPNDPTLYNSRGSAYAMRGNLDGAIAEYTEVIRLDPKCSEAYYNRGYVHQIKGERDKIKGECDKAVADCLKCLEIDPTYWLALSYMGFVKKKEGKLEESLKYYKEAFKQGVLAPASEKKEMTDAIAWIEEQLKKR